MLTRRRWHRVVVRHSLALQDVRVPETLDLRADRLARRIELLRVHVDRGGRRIKGAKSAPDQDQRDHGDHDAKDDPTLTDVATRRLAATAGAALLPGAFALAPRAACRDCHYLQDTQTCPR